MNGTDKRLRRLTPTKQARIGFIENPEPSVTQFIKANQILGGNQTKTV